MIAAAMDSKSPHRDRGNYKYSTVCRQRRKLKPIYKLLQDHASILDGQYVGQARVISQQFSISCSLHYPNDSALQLEHVMSEALTVHP